MSDLAASLTGAPAAQLAIGAVRHTRLRPRRNAFCYGAYFLRLPVRNLAQAVDQQRFFGHNRFNLLGFYDRDHARDAATPVAWIEGVLADANITDATGAIWLHAFPRVLGYVFNPVSFWFCHRPDGALRAVVASVNNTFGEHHSYLLAHADGAVIVPGEELAAQKLFHVSPFCNIEGGYRFRFLQARGQTVARIDYDDAQGPLLLTSLSGRLEPLSVRALLHAFFRFPLFTFGVVFRIHWQAAKLFAKRIPFVPKPHPPHVEVSS